MQTWPPVGALISKANQAIDFQRKASILEHRVEAVPQRIAALGVHDEQLAARLILPTEPEIGGERARAGCVLHQRGYKHPRRHRERRTAAEDRGREMTLRQADPIEGNVRFDRELA